MARHDSKRPINSVKNIVTTTNLLIAAGATVSQVIASAVDDYVGATNTVKTGSTIPWIFVELNLNNEGNITQTLNWYIWKNPADQLALPSASDPGSSANRRHILKVGMEMPAGINNSSAVKRIFVVKVPAGRQRMGQGDTWNIVITPSTTGTYDVCSKVVYKWYS